MAICEKIKKLVEAFGGEPKGDTIEDVIEDLVTVVEPDMVIVIKEETPYDKINNVNNCTITKGTVDEVLNALTTGIRPTVKVKFIEGSTWVGVFDGQIITYGEDIFVYFQAISDAAIYSHRLYITNDNIVDNVITSRYNGAFVN